jgi:hypothetical protein
MEAEVFSGLWYEVQRGMRELNADTLRIENSLLKPVEASTLRVRLLALQLNCAILMEWVVRCEIAVMAAENV